jgi:Mg-chelatase subunit ChlD
MKKILFILTALCLSVAAQNKKDLDIIESSNTENEKTSFAKTSSYSFRQISNEMISATLIEGGYFTLGTVSGLDASKLDDNCPLSYGDPFAMTSYALFSIDSTWYTMDAFFPGQSQTVMHSSADSLSLTYSVQNLFSLHFSIAIEGGTYEFYLQSTNLDTVSHHFGLGFVYDPTLAAGGDGALFVADQYITDETAIKKALSSFTIRERSESAQGLAIKCQFADSAQVIAANWPQIYQTNDPVLLNPANIHLYDLALKMFWPETLVEPSQKQAASMQMTLQQPDFSSAVFTRWDLPHFLSLEDNIMFPREFSTYMEVSSTTNNSYDCTIKMDYPGSLYPDNDEINLFLAADAPAYQKINLTSGLVYEEKVVTIGVSIMQGNQVLDTFDRLIYLPRTPVSDTGLLVEIDTVITSDYPDIKFTFNTKDEEKGHFIYNLKKENVFLYENDNRITEFTLGKDTTGGLDQADIVFVLDVTGSMGNEIEDVKNNIIEFADSLSLQGIDYQLGLVTFLDVIENVYPFTNDVDLFHNRISDQHAHGGGDGPENSLDALDAAADFDFRDLADRIIIWITDADYHEQDGVTSKSKLDVLDKILANGITVNAIGTQNFKSAYYDPITIPSGGNYYDIRGNFRDILLDISQFNSTPNNLISFISNSSEDQNSVKLELRYAGKGGQATFNYTLSETSKQQFLGKLMCYPNPFNPTVTFSISPADYKHGELAIFNILGQVVKRFDLQNGVSSITWQADNDIQSRVSSGFYYVALKLVDHSGKMHHEKAKILYLK